MDNIIIEDYVRQAHDDIINGLADTDQGLASISGSISAAIASFQVDVPNYDADQAILDEITLWSGVIATVADLNQFPHIGGALGIFNASIEIGNLGTQWQTSDVIQIDTLANLGAALVTVAGSAAAALGSAAVAAVASFFGLGYTIGNVLTRFTSLDERLTNVFFDIFEVEHRLDNGTVLSSANSGLSQLMFAAIDVAVTGDIAEKMLAAIDSGEGKPGPAGDFGAEGVLKTLERLFIPGTEPEAVIDEDAYFNRVVAVLGAIGAGYNGTVVLFPESGEIGDLSPLAEAGDGLAVRYALLNLNPIIVLGANDAATEALYNPHNQAKELDLYNPNTGTGVLTDTYLEQRARMLALKLRLNVEDAAEEFLSPEGETTFEDRASGNTFVANAGLPPDPLGGPGPLFNRNRVIFGTDADEVSSAANQPNIDGAVGNDHLFGMGGNDEIKGGAGDDVIEGGSGADRVYGEADNDTLRGGAGDDDLFGGVGADTLEGESGDDSLIGGEWDVTTGTAIDDGEVDILKGGVGDDFYHVGAGDVIEDTDNIGRLKWGPYELHGGEYIFGSSQQGETHYRDANGFVYSLSGSTLTISAHAVFADGGVITINDWQPGDSTQHSGLNMAFTEYQPPVPTNTLTGSELGDNLNVQLASIDRVEALGGDDIVTIHSGPYPGMTVLGGAGDDDIQLDSERLGGFNNDTDPAAPGAHVEGGSGDDFIEGGQGADRIFGGDDHDTIIALWGSDIVNGDSGNDWLDAWGSQDYVFGDSGNDRVLGGGGSDFLYGGLGNDVIWGDAEGLVARWDGATESYYGLITPFFAGTYSLISDSPDGDADFIYGGGGIDVVYGGQGDDAIAGGEQNDYLYGEGGDDTLDGGSGDDLLVGDIDPSIFDADNAAIVSGNTSDGPWHYRFRQYQDSKFVVGNDTLRGGAGNDQLYGQGGDDVLDGGLGADVLYGEAGNDVLFGGEQNDRLEGGAGEDQLDGGAGDDVVIGGDGDDVFLAAVGADQLFGGDGDDTFFFVSGEGSGAAFFGGSGIDQIKGSENDDVLVLSDFTSAARNVDVIDLGNGNNFISGSAESDEIRLHDVSLIGVSNFFDLGAGHDHFFGTQTGDVIKGGLGVDSMHGGGGDDVYLYDRGDHIDIISESSGENVIRFGEGIAAEDLSFEVKLGSGNDSSLGVNIYENGVITGDRIILAAWVGEKTLNDYQMIARFEFSDGSFLENPTILERGTDGDDYLAGALVIDDRRLGGEGDDYYFFSPVSVQGKPARFGDDVIVESGGKDFVKVNFIGSGLSYSDLDVRRESDSLVLDFGIENTITVENWFVSNDYRIEEFEFGDNKVNAVELERMLNSTPLIQSPLADQYGALNQPFSLSVPSTTFNDPDAGDSLTLSASLVGGAVLPGWLVFDSTTGQLSGTPGAGDAGVINLSVVATDLAGATVEDSFQLFVAENYLSGSGGASGLVGSSGVDLVEAGSGDDSIYGLDGDDYLFAGDGDDHLDGGSGDDLLDGGVGDDYYVVDSAGDQVVEGAAGGIDTVSSHVSFVLGSDVENLFLRGNADLDGTGNALDNQIYGNEGSNQLSAGAGNDLVYGQGGDDFLFGGDGNDHLDGGSGDDLLDGGVGDDYYVVDSAGDQVVEGAAGGIDTVSSHVSFVLGSDVENLFLRGNADLDGTGNALDNQIYGNEGSNQLSAGAGNDLVYGQGGDDFLFGGDGNDYLNGEAGDDYLQGGLGADLLVGGTGNDIFEVTSGDLLADLYSGGDGFDTILGGSGDDVVMVESFGPGSTVELIDLGAGNNVIIGSDDNNTIDVSATQLIGVGRIDGGAGNDILIGGEDGEFLVGGSGNDALGGAFGSLDYLGNGVSGNTYDGGAGTDLLRGSALADSYLFGRGSDTDYVVEDASSLHIDQVLFGSAVDKEQVWLSQHGDDLIVDLVGSTDKLIVEDWYLGAQHQVEQFVTGSGDTLMSSQVQQLVSAMAAFAPPTGSDLSLPQDVAAVIDPVIAVSWV